MKKRIVYSDGSTYEGCMKEDRYEGQGSFTTAEGERYVGEYKEGMMDGEFNVYMDDVHIVVSYTMDDMRKERCVVVYGGKDRYEGSVDEGMRREGKGRMVFGEGEMREYEGDWRNDEMEGQGELVWRDGRVYRGGFIGGKYQGKGVMDNGEWEVQGEWDHGKLVKVVKGKRKEGGEEFEGKVEGEMKEGEGVIRWREGRYEGGFRRDGMEGMGRMDYEGVRIEGSFEDGLLEGKATVKWEEGDVLEGVYKENMKHGNFVYKRGDDKRSCETYFQYDVENKDRFVPCSRF